MQDLFPQGTRVMFCIQIDMNFTVKPVYNGQPWELHKWPLLIGGHSGKYKQR